MQLFVMRKSLGKTRGVAKIAYQVSSRPDSLRALIVALVRHEVAEFEAGLTTLVAGDNTQVDDIEEKPSLPQRTFSQADLAELLESGRVSFGYTYHQGKVNLDKAITVALQAVEDGLVRIFINDEEVTGLDTRVQLRDGDCLTLMRLTFLTGQY